MIPSKVIRFVHRDNLMYLPKSGRVTGNATPEKIRKKNMVSVELDFHWVRKNSKIYDRLMGR